MVADGGAGGPGRSRVSGSPRYLWFAPHAGLWPSFRMEHRLADALARAGRDVTMVHCDGVLDSYCPVMAADRLSVSSPRSAKRQSCTDCRHNASIATERGSYGVTTLDAYVTPSVRSSAAALMRDVTPDAWQDVEVDGLPVGRYAAYLSMLHHKLPDVTSSEAAWAEYLSDVRNAMHVALAMPALLDDTEPTHAVVYNPLYPTTRMFAEQALRRGVQLVGVHAGSFIPARYETVGIYQHFSASQTLVDSPTIRESLAIPCTPAEIDAVGRQLREQIAGTDPWVYSSAPRRESPQALRERLGLRPEAPVVVALLSSPDETRSSMLVGVEYERDPEGGYSDISEFIGSIRRLAEAQPQLDVVLRLHPRLTPNKRESVSSPDLVSILAALADLPPNAHVNSPGDGVSLYDLIGIASAALNQSSSSGLEFMALGLPVVSYDPVRQNAYPPEFGRCVARHDDAALADAVLDAVASGANVEDSVRVFRWYATVHLRDLLHLSDLVGGRGGPPSSVPATAPVGLGGGAAASAIRRVVPESIRERGARSMARRSRAATIPPPSEEAGWRDEWLLRLDATRGSDPVWTPPITVRGEPDPSSEIERIGAVVAELRALLGFPPGD